MNEMSSQTRHNDAHSKAGCKRGSTSTAATCHTVSGGKETKPDRGTRTGNPVRSASGSQKHRSKVSAPRKLSDADSIPIGCTGVTLSSTDSSSETSDCTLKENKISNIAQSIDIEMSKEGIDRERKRDSREKLPDFAVKCNNLLSSVDHTTVSPGLGFEDRSISTGDERSLVSFDRRLNAGAPETFSDLTGDIADGLHKDLLREIDDLRSENEYLKDEAEELRSEMLEMRDMYMEEDMYQLQELRQQLDQVNKTCRILQYRLRKAERRSLRVAQTGQVDGELIRTLEHDIQVAKSVSLRLHGELEVMQKKSTQLEGENECLRERLQDLEVAKQVLQTELDKSRENLLRRRSLRSTSSKSEKKLSPLDDGADLKCQLHFAKEESALMCKKLTKTAMECESMREELARYRLLYGDVDASQAAAGSTNSAHTREAEVKVHLRLVEEEATLLSRRIVELEVENRGLRAEMSELRERAGGSQEDEDELMGAAGQCLAVSVCMEKGEEVGGGNREHRDFEKRNGGHKNSEGEGSEGCPLGQIHREEPIEGKRETLESRVRSAEIPECGSKVPYVEKCNLSLKDQETLVAIRDQATLVRSTVEFLTAPAKNGLSPSSTYSSPYLSKVDNQCEFLTSGLEGLQEQLHALVVNMESLVKSTLTDHESNSTSSGKVEDANMDPVLQTDKHAAQQTPTEEEVRVLNCTWEQNCNQDSLVLITVQLRCFLQQWREGKRPAECKSLFEMDFQKDLYCQMEAELHRSKKICKTHEKCHRQVCRVLLSDLRAVLHDLGCELQEEYLTSQHISQQFAQAKAASTVECMEPKCLIGRLVSTSECAGAKGSPDLKMASQKDHIEKLQHRLVESYAAVLDMSQQLMVCERNWRCERQEFLKHLNQACQDWHEPNNAKEPYGLRTKRVDPKAGQSTHTPNKNWLYLTQEAALIDREGPCKTWDCLIMSPSFPGLSLKKEAAQKSHTAPERTSLRIYYSPPSAHRVHLYVDKCEKPAENLQRCCNSPHKHTNGHSTSLYDSWQGTLAFECQNATECDLGTVIRSNSSSGFQSFGSSFSSCLPFSGLEVSANLSDDMKEITANVLQSSFPKPLDRRRGRGSGNHILEVVSTGTQTHALPQVNSVALQTEDPQSVCTGKQWSPRVTSFMSGHHQQIPPSMEKIPGLSSSQSLTNFSRLEVTKDHSLWPLPQCSSGSSAWAHSSATRSSSASGGGSEKPAGRKAMGIHKYGLVQELFRSVCGRGEKAKPGREKAPVVRRDHVGQVKLKKTEGPPSRIPTVQLFRSDSVTKIVNRRFIKQGHKDELGPGQTQSQSQFQCQSSKTPLRKDKGRGQVTLEDRSCDCRSRTLSSCFARASHPNLHHARNHCRLRPHEHPMAAGGKEDLPSQ